MKLTHGIHLAYCTNIHRGETWAETFQSLNEHTLRVRDRVCPRGEYAIGLRLSARAAVELSEPATLLAFRKWLELNRSYVFTINGFPYGKFHGTRVKERVYLPDWTSPERVEYTNRLFDLLARLIPGGMDGSVSTVPGSFKEFITTEEQERAMRSNLWQCVEHAARLRERTGKRLRLALEPEPLCCLETSAETTAFFEQLRALRPEDHRLDEHLGVNYDTCHLAVEFEEPREVIDQFRKYGIRISKLHFSSALKLRPNPENLHALRVFTDDVYLHQVVARSNDGTLTRYRDLDVLWNGSAAAPARETEEWRVHFHIPLHSRPAPVFGTTEDHVLGVMDALRAAPGLCSHIEMETYTWEVLPPGLKERNVVDQLAAEYEWTLARLAERGIIVM